MSESDRDSDPSIDSSLPSLLQDETEGMNGSGNPIYRYRDFSRVKEEDIDAPDMPLPSSSTRGSAETSIRVQKFPVKLYAILAQKEFHDIISWMPHGRSWKVLKPNLFESLVMPLFFEYSNYHSFNRLVNAWSFRRISSGPDRGSYYHELFLRGKPYLQKYMRRLPKTHKKQPMKKDDEPDFYALDKANPLPSLESAPIPGAAATKVLIRSNQEKFQPLMIPPDAADHHFEQTAEHESLTPVELLQLSQPPAAAKSHKAGTKMGTVTPPRIQQQRPGSATDPLRPVPRYGRTNTSGTIGSNSNTMYRPSFEGVSTNSITARNLAHTNKMMMRMMMENSDFMGAHQSMLRQQQASGRNGHSPAPSGMMVCGNPMMRMLPMGAGSAGGMDAMADFFGGGFGPSSTQMNPYGMSAFMGAHPGRFGMTEMTTHGAGMDSTAELHPVTPPYGTQHHSAFMATSSSSHCSAPTSSGPHGNLSQPRAEEFGLR